MRKLGITLFFLVLGLMLVGSIMVLTASSTLSNMKFHTPFYFFNQHLMKLGVAVFFMIFTAAIDYEYYRYYSKPALLICVLLLIATLLFAPSVKGAERWLNLGFVKLQPTEIVKPVLFIHIANLIEKKGDVIRDFKNGFIFIFIWVVMIAGLIVLQPNMSNATIIVMVSLMLLFVAGARIKHILSTLFVMGVSGLTAMMVFPHSRARILTFLSGVSEHKAANIQVTQALIGIGSGGIFGVGLGNSRQNNLFLPEPFGDFIYAIIGEELGMVGGLALILLYIAVFVVGILIAKKCQDKFGQLIALGISLMILTSAFINICVTLGITPTTGIPLPFVSYGGTSIIFLSMAIGVVINVALSNERKIAQKVLVNME